MMAGRRVLYKQRMGGAGGFSTLANQAPHELASVFSKGGQPIRVSIRHESAPGAAPNAPARVELKCATGAFTRLVPCVLYPDSEVVVDLIAEALTVSVMEWTQRAGFSAFPALFLLQIEEIPTLVYTTVTNCVAELEVGASSTDYTEFLAVGRFAAQFSPYAVAVRADVRPTLSPNYGAAAGFGVLERDLSFTKYQVIPLCEWYAGDAEQGGGTNWIAIEGNAIQSPCWWLTSINLTVPWLYRVLESIRTR